MLDFFLPKKIQHKSLSSLTFRQSKPSGLDCSSVEDHRRLSGKGSLPPIYSTPIKLPTTDFATLYSLDVCRFDVHYLMYRCNRY